MEALMVEEITKHMMEMTKIMIKAKTMKIAMAKSADNLPNVFDGTGKNPVNAWTDFPERLLFAIHNVVKITIATEIKNASLENVETKQIFLTMGETTKIVKLTMMEAK